MKRLLLVVICLVILISIAIFTAGHPSNVYAVGTNPDHVDLYFQNNGYSQKLPYTDVTYDFDVSPDCQKIVYRDATWLTSLPSYDYFETILVKETFTGKSIASLRFDAESKSHGGPIFFTFSPESNRVAFIWVSTDGGGSKLIIWNIHAGSTTVVEEKADQYMNDDLRWSSDGTLLAYSVTGNYGFAVIKQYFVVNVQTKAQRQLQKKEFDEYPTNLNWWLNPKWVTSRYCRT